MKYVLTLMVFAFFAPSLFAQKAFVGSLEYNISTVDYVMHDTTDGKLFIYAKDSIVRINYILANGKTQETIHHLNKQKMLSLIEIDGLYFAIQIKDTAREQASYAIRKKWKWEQISGLRCREAAVDFETIQYPLYYCKSIPAKYFVGLNAGFGLPVMGKIPTENGYMAFELQKIDYRTPPQALFLPDKKYKVISLDAFLQMSNGQ